MDRRALLQAKRDEIIRLAARYDARNVRVFGSVVRGEERPDSDIDFLMEFGPNTSLLDHAAIIRELEDLLGCKVDVVNDRAVKLRLREPILRNAVPL
jgi:uncharacterized protein